MKRTNLKKQEAVVSALWNFAAELKNHPTTGQLAKNLALGVTLSLDQVGTALEKIMSIFGYQIVSVQ
jgi:hypothetical protein